MPRGGSPASQEDVNRATVERAREGGGENATLCVDFDIIRQAHRHRIANRKGCVTRTGFIGGSAIRHSTCSLQGVKDSFRSLNLAVKHPCSIIATVLSEPTTSTTQTQMQPLRALIEKDLQRFQSSRSPSLFSFGTVAAACTVHKRLGPTRSSPAVYRNPSCL